MRAEQFGGYDGLKLVDLPKPATVMTSDCSSLPGEVARGAQTSSLRAPAAGVMPVRTTLFSAAAGVLIANLFGTQPVTADIAAGVGLPIASAGLVYTLTMLGYACALVFVLPLSDQFENRRLMLVTLAGNVLSLVMAALAPRKLSLLPPPATTAPAGGSGVGRQSDGQLTAAAFSGCPPTMLGIEP